MSVTEVIEQLRRAHTLLTEARNATSQADKAITDGATIFATATTGSTQPEIPKIAALAHQSTEDVRTADALFAQTQALIDAYCEHITGVGAHASIGNDEQSAVANTSRAHTESISQGAFDTSTSHYGAWIDQLRRSGTKISPERVIRMTRHRDGRLVWLEEGHIRSSGLKHIQRDDRRKNFEDAGIPPHRVIDLIFDTIETKLPIGYYGQSGEVYEIELGEDVHRRVNIVIGSNGYIVTSHPLDNTDKIRPNLDRK